MTQASPRGKLIALEGIDGAGTTTQAAHLCKWLEAQQIPVLQTREPSNGMIGVLLRRLLEQELRAPHQSVALLFAADRLDHLEGTIQPCLAEGTHVVTDRFVYSSLAYQSVKAPLEWVARLNEYAKEPDLTLYLRVSPQTAAQRRQHRAQDAELFDDLGLQERIAAQYDRLLGSKESDGAWIWSDQSSDWTPNSRFRPPEPSCRRHPTSVILDGEAPEDELAHKIRQLVETAELF